MLTGYVTACDMSAAGKTRQNARWVQERGVGMAQRFTRIVLTVAGEPIHDPQSSADAS